MSLRWKTTMFKPITITALMGMVLLSACAEMPSVSEQNAAVQTFHIAAKTVPCPDKPEQRCLVVNGKPFDSPIAGYTHTEGQAAVIVVAKTPRQTLQTTGTTTYNYRVISECTRHRTQNTSPSFRSFSTKSCQPR